jgi:hypothetical protein
MDEDENLTECRPVFRFEDLPDFLKTNDNPTPGVIVYEGEVARSAFKDIDDDTSEKLLTISHWDFSRWYRRFKSGRYERK